MAAGDRNKKGKATDVVIHYKVRLLSEEVSCGTKGWGYATANLEEVTCLKCLAKQK